ncbi:ABC transporter ATP-binding protein [Pseudactinotalea suaedae]|uniref:ABC transporter ATP-binding protein n=1 Tax=Pseudactinotalea suaedae TaxID=1524924 RepID=UPI0012E2FD56|nr:ATP-binding cassette domain-containing protein [Pseudactinotalea suaedae]
MPSDTVISTQGLTKRFTVKKSEVEAVTDLTVDVQRGALVAFLGPNGAGKSTSLRMLTTLIPPTAGSATVAGYDIQKEPAGVRSRIGYVGQGSSGSFAQRVRDELLSQGAFYGMGRRERTERADELIASLELDAFATRTVQQLSGGQKRRLDIALGLIHAPEVLFLDEPSTGLDPQSRANLWEHIIALRARYGTTVFLTTHYLEEADRYAERVMVMDSGRVIADDTAAALKADLAGDALTLTLEEGGDLARASSAVGRLAGATAEHRGDRTLAFTAPSGSALLPRLLRELDHEGIGVATATAVPPTLDDVFLALTGRTLRDADQPEGDDAPATTDTESHTLEGSTR